MAPTSVRSSRALRRPISICWFATMSPREYKGALYGGLNQTQSRQVGGGQSGAYVLYLWGVVRLPMGIFSHWPSKLVVGV